MDGISDRASGAGGGGSHAVHDYFLGHNLDPSSAHSSRAMNSVDNICYRYTNDTTTPPAGGGGTPSTPTPTTAIKSEQNVIVSIFFESLEVGAHQADIHFITPYQRKVLQILYHGISGNLTHSYDARQATFMMGRRSVVDIYTYSSFKETIQIELITSSSRLLPALMYTPTSSTTTLENQTHWTSNSSDHRGFLTAHIVSPYLQCLVPYSRLRKINLWGCITVLLEEWLTSSVTPSSSSSLLPSSTMISHEEYGIYTAMLDLLRPIEAEILSGSFEQAFSHISEFRKKWLTSFPLGLPIPEFHVLFKSSVTVAPLMIPDIHIQLPLASSSFYSSFILTPISYAQVVFIYFLVTNPYDTPLEIKLLDDFLPLALFTEHHLDKLPDLDSFITSRHRHRKGHQGEGKKKRKVEEEEEEGTVREEEKEGEVEEEDELKASSHHRTIYPFEFPELLSPYSHRHPNTIHNLRDIQKIVSQPRELKRKQKTKKVATSLSTISLLVDEPFDFIDEECEEVEGEEEEAENFFILKNLLTIPRYLRGDLVVDHHPLFSRYTPSTTHILPPHTTQLIGPLAFMPLTTDQEYPYNERYYNVTLYLHNNYSGIEKIEVICPVSKIHVTISSAEINAVDPTTLPYTPSPPFEPIPSPLFSHNQPGLITLSYLPLGHHLGDSSFTSSSSSSSEPPLPPPLPFNEIITVMANQEYFIIQIYLNNTSRLETVIDKILLNGRYDICSPHTPPSLLFPDQKISFFHLFSQPSPLLLFTQSSSTSSSSSSTSSSSSFCQQFPLILLPNESQSFNLTFQINCKYLSEQFTLSFLSTLYSSTRGVFLLHCSVYLTMSSSLMNFCRMKNFEMDSDYSFIMKLFGLLVLGMLSFQTQQLNVLLHNAENESDEKSRLRSPEGVRNKKGGLKPLTYSHHGLPLDLSHSSSATSEEFPYLRKGIHLQDVPLIDPSNSHYEAIDTLKSKRISNYYSPGPSGAGAMAGAKILQTSSSSSVSLSTEEINLEDIEKNIRNPILLMSTSSSSFEIPAIATVTTVSSTVLVGDGVLMETSDSYETKEEVLEVEVVPEVLDNLTPLETIELPLLNKTTSSEPLVESSAVVQIGDKESESHSSLPSSPTKPLSVEVPITKPTKKTKKERNASLKASKAKAKQEELLPPPQAVDTMSPEPHSELTPSVVTLELVEPSTLDPVPQVDITDSINPPSEISVLDFLGSEALRASVIDSVLPTENTIHQISAAPLSPPLGDEDDSVRYLPNTFDTYETHEMWEHAPLPPTPLNSSNPPAAPFPIVKSVGYGLESMVSGIVDSAEMPLLKSESTDSTSGGGVIQPNPSYDDWQHEQAKGLTQAPTPPPGFAGALGTYEYFSYYPDPLTSPRQDDSLQVPLDPSYLRSGQSNISPVHGAIGEGPSSSFLTPPRGFPSSSSTSSTYQQAFPQLFSLPAAATTTNDLLGGDEEWEAMFTMPFEDMRGLGNSNPPNPMSSLRDGSFNDSVNQPPLGFESFNPHSSPSSSAFFPSHDMTSRPNQLGMMPAGQSYQHHQPLYRSPPPGSNYSYDGRIGRNPPAAAVGMGNYNPAPPQPPPGGDLYPPPGYGNPYAPNQFNPSSSSPGRSFQGEYQQRQYNPRTSRPLMGGYDGSEMSGMMGHPHPSQMNNPPFMSHPGVGYRGGGGGLYGSDHRFAQQPVYGLTPHQHQQVSPVSSSYPYPQSELFGMPSSLSYHSGGAPGLSPAGAGGGGYYQPSQYPSPSSSSQREREAGGNGNGNNRHN
jgi:hypothetical protein